MKGSDYMPTINKELEALSFDEIQVASERYLMGWHDPKYDGHNYRIKGLNRRRCEYGLEPLTREWSQSYRIDYIKNHYSDDDIVKNIYEYCKTHDMESSRWSGIYLFDCRFGREYVKIFKELLGAKRWRQISEQTRVQKLVMTQTELYGGVGVGGAVTYNKMLETKIDNHRLLKKFDSIGEEVVYDLLVDKFGISDVIYQYGIHPYDERYPYSCDFYIKSLDLFIELNTHYSHSDHWFDETNANDINKVFQWQCDIEKYHKAIRQWTESDIAKRNSAKNHHLNYLVFWDGRHRRNKNLKYSHNYMPVLEDFMEWYYTYDCDVVSFLNDNPCNTY